MQSGLGITCCFSRVYLVFSLYEKSPSALLSARFPLTRLFSTYPSAFSILSRSSSFSGLWSYDRAMVLPCLDCATARLSPALAKYTMPFLIKHTLAVQPPASVVFMLDAFTRMSEMLLRPLGLSSSLSIGFM